MENEKIIPVAQPPIDKTREVPKEGRTYGWILGNEYQERGYHDEGDKGDGGEPWYLTVDGTPWSAFDVRFFPDHEFNGVPHRNDPTLLLCDFVFHNRRCDLTQTRHDELFPTAASLQPPSPQISHCALCEDPSFIYRDCVVAAQQRGAELQRAVDIGIINRFSVCRDHDQPTHCVHCDLRHKATAAIRASQ